MNTLKVHSLDHAIQHAMQIHVVAKISTTSTTQNSTCQMSSCIKKLMTAEHESLLLASLTEWLDG